MWDYLFGPVILFFRSSFRPSVTLSGFTISSVLIQGHYIYRKFLCTVAYSVELWRRNVRQAMPTVEYELTRRSALFMLEYKNRRKKQPSGSLALLDIVRSAETLSREIQFFSNSEKDSRIRRYIPRGFKAKKICSILVLWIGAMSLKLESLITKLFICKISSHTRDWIDRLELNMGHRILLSI
jgi:hypothetical protein